MLVALLLRRGADEMAQDDKGQLPLEHPGHPHIERGETVDACIERVCGLERAEKARMLEEAAAAYAADEAVAAEA